MQVEAVSWKEKDKKPQITKSDMFVFWMGVSGILLIEVGYIKFALFIDKMSKFMRSFPFTLQHLEFLCSHSVLLYTQRKIVSWGVDIFETVLFNTFCEEENWYFADERRLSK